MVLPIETYSSQPTFLSDLEKWLDKVTLTPSSQLSERDKYNYHRLRTLLYLRRENRGRGLYYDNEFREIETMVSEKPFIFAEYTSSLLFGGDRNSHIPVFQDWISQLEKMREYQINEVNHYRMLLEKYPDEYVEDRKIALEAAELEFETIAGNIIRLMECIPDSGGFIRDSDAFRRQPYVFAGHLHNGAILLGKQVSSFGELRDRKLSSPTEQFLMRFYHRLFLDRIFGYDTREAMKRTLEEFDNGLGRFALVRQRITEKDIDPIVVFSDLDFKLHSPLTEDSILKVAKAKNIPIDTVEYPDVKYCSWQEAKFRESADRMYQEVETAPSDE